MQTVEVFKLVVILASYFPLICPNRDRELRLKEVSFAVPCRYTSLEVTSQSPDTVEPGHVQTAVADQGKSQTDAAKRGCDVSNIPSNLS